MLWIAQKVFSIHLRGNRRWVPLLNVSLNFGHPAMTFRVASCAVTHTIVKGISQGKFKAVLIYLGNMWFYTKNDHQGKFSGELCAIATLLPAVDHGGISCQC